MSTCYASLELAGLRVTTLDENGIPDAGPNNGYMTDAAISLAVTVESEAGQEFVQKNGLGAICATFKQPDLIKRVTLATELCQLDSELLAMLTGGSVFTSGGSDVIGGQMPEVGSTPGPVALEAWTKAWDGGEQALDPYTSPDRSFFHFVFPFTRWVQGQFTADEGFMVIPVNGQGDENSAMPDDGPYGDWPAEIAAQGGVTRIGGWFLDGTVPTAQCGSIEVPVIGS